MQTNRKYSRLMKNKMPAFTLVESLLALIVITGMLLVYQGLSRSVFSHMAYLRENDQDKWLLFSQQFRAECMGAHFRELRNGRLYIEKEGKEVAFGFTDKKDFRKASANWHGYHPLLLNLADVNMVEKDKRVTIKLYWPSGLERTFIYDFKEKS
ncbi:competence type IV pilus minor pilin ComGF [Streptococcus penaeicida]